MIKAMGVDTTVHSTAGCLPDDEVTAKYLSTAYAIVRRNGPFVLRFPMQGAIDQCFS